MNNSFLSGIGLANLDIGIVLLVMAIIIVILLILLIYIKIKEDIQKIYERQKFSKP
mgnify:CR=1 FL=1